MDKQASRKRKCTETEDKSENSFDVNSFDVIKREKKSFETKSLAPPSPELSRPCECDKTLCRPTDVLDKKSFAWKELRAENLNCDYCILYNRDAADELVHECEQTLTYNEGEQARVQVFGKWYDIPRKQAAYGDSGLSYKFSNNTIQARPWVPLLEKIRDRITAVTGYSFNFVLVNRYKDGTDHMGEHKDDEKDLISGYPIASLSLGQPRDFVFKHGDSRGKNARRHVPPVMLELEHGSLLLMKHPTNTFWYHSLPKRKRLTDLRINMTFRKMVVNESPLINIENS